MYILAMVHIIISQHGNKWFIMPNNRKNPSVLMLLFVIKVSITL